MTFIWPAMLLLLLAIPLGVALYLTLERRRRRRIAAHGSFAGAAHPASATASRLRRRLPALLMLLGLTTLVVALARPQSPVSLPRVEGTVILTFDVSGSMAADDMTPTRMEAAKVAARAFVERQPDTILMGVVAFSDSGFSIQAPTNDRELVLTAIDRMEPERGTSLARGIQTALTTIEEADADAAAGYYTNRSPEPTPVPTPVPDGVYAPAAIVLLTDGENNQRPDPVEAAEAAADRGVRIHTVGIGSAEGVTLTIEGFVVHSRLDEALLRQISELTDGSYHTADDPEELSAIYEDIDTRLVVRPEEIEVTSLLRGRRADPAGRGRVPVAPVAGSGAVRSTWIS